MRTATKVTTLLLAAKMMTSGAAFTQKSADEWSAAFERGQKIEASVREPQTKTQVTLNAKSNVVQASVGGNLDQKGFGLIFVMLASALVLFAWTKEDKKDR